MKLVSSPCRPCGDVHIPASKSHTIRALLIATLAEGTSEIHAPLLSSDTTSCLHACKAFGAHIVETDHAVHITGIGGMPHVPEDVVDVGNSGTTLFLALSLAALAEGHTVFTGDYQIRRRSAEPLLVALRALGAEAYATRNNGCAPLVVRGPLAGGKVSLACPTSQYLSSLLLSCPCALGDTDIQVTQLNEKPYVTMTLEWLKAQGVALEYDADYASFHVPGGQKYSAFSRTIAGDFSSATFFLVGAALCGKDVRIHGMDMNDAQGDKAVVDMLRAMGASIEEEGTTLCVRGGQLCGTTLDLNATPDALPALAVAACAAEGETRLVNVAHARLKETDRIAVMCRELRALGADCEETDDGLVIRKSVLRGGSVQGYDDHRVVMALALAGMYAKEPVTINGAEAMRVTFPTYVELWNALGARMECYDE